MSIIYGYNFLLAVDSENTQGNGMINQPVVVSNKTRLIFRLTCQTLLTIDTNSGFALMEESQDLIVQMEMVTIKSPCSRLPRVVKGNKHWLSPHNDCDHKCPLFSERHPRGSTSSRRCSCRSTRFSRWNLHRETSPPLELFKPDQWLQRSVVSIGWSRWVRLAALQL